MILYEDFEAMMLDATGCQEFNVVRHLMHNYPKYYNNYIKKMTGEIDGNQRF